MLSAQQDLFFDKDSWLRAEFQFIHEDGTYRDTTNKRYRFIAKESITSNVELFNQIIPIIAIDDPDAEDAWMTKIEVSRDDNDVTAEVLDYIIREESTLPNNTFQDEILVHGKLSLYKRI